MSAREGITRFVDRVVEVGRDRGVEQIAARDQRREPGQAGAREQRFFCQYRCRNCAGVRPLSNELRITRNYKLAGGRRA